MSRAYDCAWAPHPDPAKAKQFGYVVSGRYASSSDPSHDGNGGYPGKDLSPPEVTQLRSAGMGIFGIWETTAGESLLGEAAGRDRAQRMNAKFDALGAPLDMLVVATTDTDATPDAVDPFYKGFTAASKRPNTCVYGGIWVTDQMVRRGRVRFGWQTVAWSYTSRVQSMLAELGLYHGAIDGAWGPQTQTAWDAYGGVVIDGTHVSNRACMFQRLRSTAVIPGGADYDENAILRIFPYWGAPVPPPKPEPVPVHPYPTWQEVGSVKTTHVQVPTDSAGKGVLDLGTKVLPLALVAELDIRNWPGFDCGATRIGNGNFAVVIEGGPPNSKSGVGVNVTVPN